ncbi:hypothetical protein RGQ13_15105 [Thalassotalea psychrophila]|uniref:Uncharacterized protein n=1 Tax=Thalassotalea psychrophila TaxID=3065647 RepID=A0ABY9TRS8_9GAMM|nr:hypothetical protein RGQ13_15105 [Colwelliaceae bacterium SQ149]
MDKPIKVPVTLVQTWISLVNGNSEPFVKSSSLDKIICHFGSLKQAEAHVAMNSECPEDELLILERKKARMFGTQLKLKAKHTYWL